ncbi:MAG: hypothetical protein DSY55_03295 [Clostridia bacterium]|nr:MAG: hypothetical protein DSY55_03295 [Clostridia bacterium]
MKKTRLFLRTSGGMGVEIEGKVTLDDLPEALLEQVQTLLHPKTLSRSIRTQGRLRSATYPDQMNYDLIVQTGAKKTKRYQFTEDQATPELLDILDELISFMIDQKLNARKSPEATAQKNKKQSSKIDDAEILYLPKASLKKVRSHSASIRDEGEEDDFWEETMLDNEGSRRMQKKRKHLKKRRG